MNLFFKKTPFNTMMHPLNVKDDDKVDYLNLNKSVWQDPQTETILSKSVYELIEDAKIEAKDWCKLVQEAYDGNKVNVEEFTNEFIYDGYKEGNKMKVFKSVYKKEEDNK